MKQQVYLYWVILSYSTFVYIFLIYNHLKQEKDHSWKQEVYLYQVILSNSILVYIFLIYNHSKQEINHSIKQQVYLYQVILSNSTLDYISLIYNHSKQEINHSIKQQVYLYQVILSNSTLVYIFLIYNHSRLVNVVFMNGKMIWWLKIIQIYNQLLWRRIHWRIWIYWRFVIVRNWKLLKLKTVFIKVLFGMWRVWLLKVFEHLFLNHISS